MTDQNVLEKVSKLPWELYCLEMHGLEPYMLLGMKNGPRLGTSKVKCIID